MNKIYNNFNPLSHNWAVLQLYIKETVARVVETMMNALHLFPRMVNETGNAV
jgi:hypothetical protein